MATIPTVSAQYTETPEQITTSIFRSHPIFRRYVRPCCAEILGTLAFTFFSLLSVISTPEMARPVVVSLINAATIYALYGSLAHISGGHYNPAISFASWLGGGTGFILMLFYMICHILGGFLGALLFRTILLRNVYLISAIETVPVVNYSYTTIGQAILIELIGSCIWSFVILMTTVDGNKPPQTAGSFVASAVFIASLLSYNLTKASLNPAKAFGSTLAYTIFANGEWDDHYVFWVGPFLGAAFAVIFYRFMLASDDKRLYFKK